MVLNSTAMPKKMSAPPPRKKNLKKIITPLALAFKKSHINKEGVPIYKNTGRYNEVTKSAVGTIPGSPVGD